MFDLLVNGVDRGVRALSEAFARRFTAIAGWKPWITAFWWPMTGVSSASCIWKVP